MSFDTTPEAVASEAGGAVPSASDAISSTPIVETTPSTTEAEAPKQTLDDTLKAAFRNSKRSRDDAGRFAPKDGASNTALADALTTPQEQVSAEATPPVEQQVEQAKPPLDPPAHMTAEQKADFSKLPREAQELVSRFAEKAQADFTRRAQEVANERKQIEEYRKAADPFFQALKPFESYLGQVAQSERMPVPQLLHGLVQTEARLRTGNAQEKAAAFYELANYYGVPLDGSGQENALMGTITHLRQRLDQVTGYLTQQQQAEYARRQEAEQTTFSELQRTISEFAKDKPYFDEVRPYAAALLEKGLANDLQSAYDMAVHANPTIRAQLQAEQNAAAEAKRQAEAKAKADQARRAAAPNVRSGPASNPSPKSMDDTMREAYRRIAAS
jgi:hypothetical protein